MLSANNVSSGRGRAAEKREREREGGKKRKACVEKWGMGILMFLGEKGEKKQQKDKEGFPVIPFYDCTN